MKKFFKKIIGLICILAMIVTLFPTLSLSTKAAEIDSETITISEYDYITAIRSLSPAELSAANLSEAEVLEITSNTIEQELLERKGKSDEELMNHYGYSTEDIAILRAYNGENIEDNVELAALTGTLTIKKPTVLTATTTRIGVRVQWSWDQCPFVVASDVLGVYWEPTFGSANGNMRIKINECSHVVSYYDAGVYVDVDAGFEQVSPNASARSDFGMTLQNEDFWAKKGTATLYFDATSGSAALTEMDMIFAYGHTILSVSPSISFPASGGISFGFNTDEADKRSGYINVANDTWTDN